MAGVEGPLSAAETTRDAGMSPGAGALGQGMDAGAGVDGCVHADASSGACAEASASGGAAPVILLHGFAQTPRSWDAVANALRACGHEVHVPDLYVQVRPFSLDAACRRVAEIVRDVVRASGEPCVVAGYSMGGRIALETLARAQAAGERLPLSALALEGAGLGPADESAREAFRARGDAWAADLRENGVAAFMDRWETLPLFASQRALSADVRARVRSDRVAHDAEELCVVAYGGGAALPSERG